VGSPSFWDRPVWVLIVITGVQVICSAAILLVPSLAPRIAADFGIATGLVGVQVSVLYGVAMLTSMQAGAISRRFGPCRSSQVAMLMVIGGSLCALLRSPWGLVVATVLLGIAYGLTNPAASQLLARYTTLGNRNLVYSLKQTGVPLGGVLAALGGPPLAQSFGWRAGFVAMGALALGTLLLLQLPRANWDQARDRAARISGFGSLGVLRRCAPVFWLGATGFLFAAAQLSLISFAVAFMVEDLAMTLVTAGIIMSLIHVAGTLGRVGWGALADRLRHGIGVLNGLAVSMAVIFTALATLGNLVPVSLVVGLLVVAGGTAIAWNGVYLAEVARRAPAAEVSDATAGVLVLTYMGVLAGPALFSLLLALTGRYSAGFLLPAVTAGLGLITLALCARAIRADGSAPA
jgi:predicted MFS family arabinose efflux permease